MRRWRTRPSVQRTVITHPDDEIVQLFQTMLEERKIPEEDEEVEDIDDETVALRSIFKKPTIRKKPERDLDEEIKEEEAKLLREQEKVAFELKQAEDFSLCIEEEGTGKRLYLESDGKVVEYDAVKREDCKQKLEEHLAEQRKRLEDLRQARELQPKRKATTLNKPKKKKKEQKVAEKIPPQIVQELSLEQLEEHQTAQTSKRSVTFSKRSLAYSAEPSAEVEVETINDSDPETQISEVAQESDDIGRDEETELEPKTSQESLHDSEPPPSEEMDDSSKEIHGSLDCPSTSTKILSGNIRTSAPRRFSQLPFSPIQQSTVPDHSPKGVTTNVFTSTPVGSKGFTTSTPFTVRNETSKTMLLFETDEESITDKENISNIQEEEKAARKSSEVTTAATTVNSTHLFTDNTNVSTFNFTTNSVIQRRNFTQIVSFYDNDTQRKKSLYYLKDYEGDITENNAFNHLLHVVRQKKPISWPELKIRKAKKLGEGTYGEVFLTTYEGRPSAVKIIPFNNSIWRYEGVINGELLMEPIEVLPEILITKAVAELEEHEENNTPNFIKLYGAHVVQGKYPELLLKEWDIYKERKEQALNDRPTKYHSETQLFLALFLSKGGEDLESITLRDESQVISVFLQVALSLLVAQKELQFEHRDLHWGNILVDDKCSKTIKYRYEDTDLFVVSHGVKVNIIDFTLSRMSKGGSTFFKDLSKDHELFIGPGLELPKDEELNGTRDYQFDIYRMMKKESGDVWTQFIKKTNVLWAHYLIRQMVVVKKCKKPISQARQNKIMKVFDELLNADDLTVIFTNSRMCEITRKYIVLPDAKG